MAKRRLYNPEREVKRPEYLKSYVQREGEATRSVLHSSIYQIQTRNLSTMTLSEIKKIGNSIIREANLRMKELESANLKSSPAYQYIKTHTGKSRFSLAGDDRPRILNQLRYAVDFLHTKTSVVSGAAEYGTWLDRHIGVNLDEDEKVELWEIIHAFENTNPERFVNYGYDVTIRQISTAYNLTRDKELTRKAFIDYLRGEGMIADLERGSNEDLKKALDMAGVEPWIKRDL